MKFTIEARLTTKNLERPTLVTGASGSGKSLLLKVIGTSLAFSTAKKRNLASMVIIDPHADVSNSIMALRNINPDRLVYISTTAQRDSGWEHGKIVPIFNPFQLPKDADEDYKVMLASQLAETISGLVDTGQYGITINMHMILLPCILVCLSSPNPCLNSLKSVLEGDPDLLRIGLEYPHPQIMDFFRNHFSQRDYDLSKRALISKINYIQNDINLYNTLNGQGIDLEECLETGKIIILNAPSGSNPFAANILARMLLSVLFSLLLRRENKQRTIMPCYILLDEANSYATHSVLADMLRQSRKFGARLIISLQSLKSLPTDLKGALLTNTYLKLLSITDSETRSLMQKEMLLDSSDIDRIEPLTFMVAKNDGMKSKAFRIRVPFLPKTMFLNPLETKQRIRHLIAHSGVFKQVPPPPPPVPFTPTENTQKKKTKKNSTTGGLSPGFNS